MCPEVMSTEIKSSETAYVSAVFPSVLSMLSVSSVFTALTFVDGL